MGAKTRIRDTSRRRGPVGRAVLDRLDVARERRAAWATVKYEAQTARTRPTGRPTRANIVRDLLEKDDETPGLLRGGSRTAAASAGR
jgi:hypothetical protein